jgi:hypothetical protein
MIGIFVRFRPRAELHPKCRTVPTFRLTVLAQNSDSELNYAVEPNVSGGGTNRRRRHWKCSSLAHFGDIAAVTADTGIGAGQYARGCFWQSGTEVQTPEWLLVAALIVVRKTNTVAAPERSGRPRRQSRPLKNSPLRMRRCHRLVHWGDTYINGQVAGG